MDTFVLCWSSSSDILRPGGKEGEERVEEVTYTCIKQQSNERYHVARKRTRMKMKMWLIRKATILLPPTVLVAVP